MEETMLDYPREHQEAYKAAQFVTTPFTCTCHSHQPFYKKKEDQGSHLPLRKKRGAPVAILPSMKGAIDS